MRLATILLCAWVLWGKTVTVKPGEGMFVTWAVREGFPDYKECVAGADIMKAREGGNIRTPDKEYIGLGFFCLPAETDPRAPKR